MPIIKYGLDATGLTRGTTKAKKELASISKTAKSVGSSLGGMFTPLNAALGALGTGFGAFKLAEVGDSYTNMASQLEFLTGSTEEAVIAQEQLFQMSQRTRTSTIENSKALTRFALASEMTGLNMEENITVLGNINTLMARTGVSTQESASSMIQLGQALASGRLQGDEFRSMSENVPALMNKMAESLGVTRAELKEMSTAGELTSEVLGKVFLEMGNSADATAESLPLTISGMWTKVANSTERMWDKINDETGILSWVATGFDNLAMWVEDNTDTVVQFFVKLKDSAVESWPKIKEFFAGFFKFGSEIVTLFTESWPAIQTVIKTTVDIIVWATPHIKTILDWVLILLPKIKELAAYTPLAAISRAAGTIAGGGNIIDAGRSFFDADGSTLESETETTNTTSTAKSGTNIYVNEKVSRSDVANIALELDRRESLI